MKKLILAVVVAAALTLVLVRALRTGPDPAKFVIGPPLPAGKVAPQLVCTWDTAVLLAPDGSLWGWGGTEFGMPGLFATSTYTPRPRRVGTDSDWRMVAAGMNFTLALRDDGSLWGQGNNQSGQLAQTHFHAISSSFTRIGTDTHWMQISVGGGHCLALKTDGSLWGWGQNESGQVGDGTTNNQTTPTQLSPDHDWKSIATGGFNSFALKTDGTVWGWGLATIISLRRNVLAPAKIDPGSNWVSLSASDFALLALKADGTLWIWGQNAHVTAPQYVSASTATFVEIGNDNDWQDVRAGSSFFFARKRDGSWWVCGHNDHGQLGLGGDSRQTVVQPQRLPFDFDPWAFAAGQDNAFILARDGTIWNLGKRLGSPPVRQLTSRWEAEFYRALNFVKKHLMGPNSQTNKDDSSPYRIWEFPSAMRNSLIKNAHSDTQSGATAVTNKKSQP